MYKFVHIDSNLMTGYLSDTEHILSIWHAYHKYNSIMLTVIAQHPNNAAWLRKGLLSLNAPCTPEYDP